MKCKHCGKRIVKSPDYDTVVWVHKKTDMCRCYMLDDKTMAEPLEGKKCMCFII